MWILGLKGLSDQLQLRTPFSHSEGVLITRVSTLLLNTITIFVFDQMPLYCILSVQPLVLYTLYISDLSFPQTSFKASLNMVPLGRTWTHAYQLNIFNLLLPVWWQRKCFLWYQIFTTATTIMKIMNTVKILTLSASMYKPLQI